MTNAAAARLAPATLARFIEYAEDADNWDGNPLIGGNVGGDASDKGFVLNMKKAGLVTTWVDGDDKSLVELLLAVDSQKYTMDELKRACDEVLNGRCVTRAVIEQRALLERSGSSEVLQELEEQECCGLGHHRFAIESPAMYDEILRVDRDKEVS